MFGCDLDTTAMSRAEARELLRLIEQANLQEVGERRHPQGRDLLIYEIVLEENGKRITASFDSMTTPPQVEPLRQFLARRARAVPLE